MNAIRGATTVETDSPEQIKFAVEEMLCEMTAKNKLNENEIICIMFSTTSDLHSYYPAKAAREAGFSACPLYSSLEPDIDGALKKCIRIMIISAKDEKPVHVYLNGAKILRKDLSETINIAIDGPAGSGKSTVSKILAKKLNILCLDTGAMYRACALKLLSKNADLNDETNVKNIADNTNIEVKYINGVQKTYLDGNDVSDEIRLPEVAMAASKASAYSCIRNKMVELQRKIAKENSCVLDGRDIGTNVLPDARFKFFLTATPEVRASRRFEENAARGIKTTYKQILNEIVKRDENDRTRKTAPLKQAVDAVFIDSSEMTVEEVVALILKKIQEKI